ncbi:MAG TPA: VOC family protein [Rhodocyclaceae bacterium]|nr:VOC family protein [Rhodocyclaceae bacterium]HNB64784.1 VOC family protein [Rhodocyclaceae bacterium]HND24274.1 VOC family protein [Rhodocyclaceae bacterium]HNE15886.1 VOC family protein [Rhodocyclaceae bacterium]
MPTNPVVHFEIYVQDMARARAFYENVLGTTLVRMPAPTPEMDLDMLFFPMDKDTGMNTYGSGGMLVRMEGMASGGGGTLVYFACEDCAVQAARAAEFGGRLCKEKTSIGEHGFFSLAQDSEGNMIGFHSMK